MEDERKAFDEQAEQLDAEERGELMEILLNTREQGEMVEQLIKNQIEVKDGMIDSLHKELELYRQGAADKFVEQVMKALIKVRKDMARRMNSEEWGGMPAKELQKEYRYVFEDLTDLLEQQNVDSYETSRGDLFDPGIHQAKIEATDDPGRDKRIARSLCEGYKKGGKVLLPERVVVYQYKEQ